MKNILSLSLISVSLFYGTNSVKAEWDYWVLDHRGNAPIGSGPNYGTDSIGTFLYTINSKTGERTLKHQQCFNQQYNVPPFDQITCDFQEGQSYINPEGNLTIKMSTNSNIYEYKENINKFSLYSEWDSDYEDSIKRPISRVDENGNKIIEMAGSKLIEQKANGEFHIGKNSWITKEENGRQKVWAKDAAGNSIPIDYTNGTKLLINGRDVEQSINNVGALSAALTGLPTVPTDTTLACGLGTGTHGGNFAFSGGCASKVNEKLSINYAASMTMPGQDYAGDFEDTFSARAGFVWKLGKSVKPTLISMKAKEKMEEKIYSLEENNKKIISQNKTLLARLERLEKVALSEAKSKDLATIKLP